MVGAPAEAPNSKPPSKSRSRNTKHQARNSREAPSSQIPSSKGGPRFGAWNLGFLWCLELGVCCWGSLIGLPVLLVKGGAGHATRPSHKAGRRDRRRRPTTK